MLAEDACTSLTAELHEVAVRSIFPRISRVRKSADISLTAS